jgi:purine-nucleoside phosphorylase
VTSGNGQMRVSDQAHEAAEAVRAAGGPSPRAALILGTGLGDLAEEITTPMVVPYERIPHFAPSTVSGHAGQLVLGQLEDTPVVAMRGRVHLYEGYSARQVAFPVRVMRRLGADVLIVTNAAGGLNESLHAGDLMLLTDHLNLPGLAGHNPLIGPDDPGLGVRFLDMLSTYSPELRALAHAAATRRGFAVREGVYAMVAGPSFETPAELSYLRQIGADAVGMSTVPEVIVARHERMRVLGISAITNMTLGQAAPVEVSHQDVLAIAARVRPRLAAVVRGVLRALTAPS